MIFPVTTAPTKILEAKPGCEILAMQNDEAPGGEPIFVSFDGPDMTEDGPPAPAGYRIDPGKELVLTCTTPLIKQAEVWAVVATGTANLRVIRR